MKKIFKNPILTFILGLILSGSVVYAATLIAGDITYDNTKTNINADNVQDAIDALYNKANSGSGKTICTYVESEYGNASDHYSIGTKYSCEVKENTRYNFYVLTNHTDSVDLIMERNITELVGTTKTMNWQTAMDYFRNGAGSALNWQVPVDLPKAQAIADAVGNTGWNTTSNDFNGWFCLGLHDQNSCTNNKSYDKATDAGINAIAPYKWLFNYTRECSAFGCDATTSLSEGEAYGYWTTDMVINSSNPARAWYVTRYGYLDGYDVSNTVRYGVRPVISILKSNMN